MVDLQKAMAENARAVGELLDRLLKVGEGREARLMEAMRYSALGGGKRIRPFMVWAGAHLFAVAESCARHVDAAIRPTGDAHTVDVTDITQIHLW